MQYVLFHDENGSTNARQCYVVRTLPVLLFHVIYKLGGAKISQNCATTLLNVHLFLGVISIFVNRRLPPLYSEFFVAVNFKRYLTSHNSL
jgi:hypothetical protein